MSTPCGINGGFMLTSLQRFAVFFSIVSLLSSAPALSQERPYREGSVWAVSLVKTKSGLSEVYLREVIPARKKIMDEALKQGLIISHKIFQGSSSNREDWDIMFLEEYKNWAAFDGLTAKFDAVLRKIVGDEAAQTQVAVKRIELRDYLNEKVMQELVPQ
jgi:hypothetical protein